MKTHGEIVEDTAEEFFEEAPCGLISTRADGRIIKVNRTFESWTGFSRDELLARRFQDLLSAGGRIYYETHYSPLLQVQGSVREIAVEILRADGSRLPALVNSVLRRDAAGRPQVVRTTVSAAADRRRYEEELRLARRREQEIARQLQGSMLSHTLPSNPGLELDFAYRPAVTALDVGGDWYDAFCLDDDQTLGLVVGDVVGRGIEAAVTMGQLRSAVRALASTGLPPSRLLDALDRYTRRHEVGQGATLVYAELALKSGRLRYACAGHPPPAITAADGAPYLAWEGRSVPLDASVGAPIARDESELLLRPGERVVLYTDGLIESRLRDLDSGMDELLAELASNPDVAAATLIHKLRDTDHADDVCVLAARLRPQRSD
ncbi:MAG: SpoIIE family protein phosphatase [Actinobacteria bacterium]|nr:SpoIIE family protein phosphatase [Actinomycetota bacterium]